MQQMMNDPQMMNQWHQTMMNNPQAMNNWMNTMMSDPQAMQQMHTMMNNPQHMNMMMGPMMNTMMNDPSLQQQMIEMMMQNQGMMNTIMQNQQMMGMMTGMRGGGSMMGQGMMMGQMMMGTPITKETDVLKTIDKIEDLLDQVSSKYNEGDSASALSLATTAYLENYEYIESSIASKDSTLMEKVELMLRRDLRHAINTEQPAEEIDTKIDSIKEELQKIRALFQ